MAEVAPGEAVVIAVGEGGGLTVESVPVAATVDPGPIRAAGIMYQAPDGQVLFLRRSDGQGWAFPGGHIEDGETATLAAIRESAEEMGIVPEVSEVGDHTRRIKDGVDFTTLIAQATQKFTPTLNDEHTGFMWADPALPPEPLHPGCAIALARLTMHELDIAKAIRDGELTSPQRYKNLTLQAIRITGTGTSHRDANGQDEWTHRPAAHYLTPEFCERCQGLPVVFLHPHRGEDGKGDPFLNTDNFADHIIGSVMLAYVQGDEVWGVARIIDADAAKLMASRQLSTSPGVQLDDFQNLIRQPFPDGSTLLIEKGASLVDHIAICMDGVWDKGQGPSGVLVQGVSEMAEQGDDDKKDDAVDEGSEATEDKKDDAAEGEGDESKKDDAADEDEDKKDDTSDARMDALEARLDAALNGRTDTADIAALRKEVAALRKSSAPAVRTEADISLMASAQARCDEVAVAFGKKASAPLQGESATAYRRRLAAEYQGHSAAWKGADLRQLSGVALDNAEAAIFADAQAAAFAPAVIGPGQLRESIRTDETGRRIKEYHGDMSVWLDGFRIPGKRVAKFNTQPHQGA